MNVKFLLDSISHISIGNGTVYNFIDYIGEMHITGGILNYTRNTRLLEYNLFNNFSYGTRGRYGYGGGEYRHNENLDSRLYYKVGDGESVNQVSLKQDKIGEQYVVPEGSKNSSLKFLSEYGFLTLADYIRNENLKYNIRSDIFKTRYGYYNPNAFVASGVTYPAEIGDYAVDTDFRKEYQRFVISRKTLKDNEEFKTNALNINNQLLESQGVDNENYKDYDVSNFDEFKTKIRYPSKKHKNLVESGNIFREELLKYRIINKKIADSQYSRPDISDVYSVPYLKRMSSFLTSNVNDVIEINNDIILKNTSRDFGNVNGHWKAAYGISTPEDIEFYSVYNKNTLGDTTSIDGKIRGGSLVKKNILGNNKTYTYFAEPDGKTSASIGRTNTFDNFTPILMSDGDEKSSSSLLQKTNKLFKDNKIKSLINRFHTESITNPSDVESSYDSFYGMSRGRNLLRGGSDKTSGYDNPYCRVWTAHHQYSKLKDRIRPFVESDTFVDIQTIQKGLGPLRSYEGPGHFASHTVLQNNGLVRIGPTIGEQTQNIQNFMFSIENLAWKGHTYGLTKTQVGPNNGRIMWFPPYNLKFTENVNVQWQDNSFIGRGEKIYTYTNTERQGTLNFTLLIDHPSIIDAWRTQNVKNISSDQNEETLLKFFAGCSNIELEPTSPPEPEQEEIVTPEEEEPFMSEDETFKVEFFVFFPNDFSGIDNIEHGMSILDNYETNAGGTTEERDNAFEDEILDPSNVVNENKFNLNTTAGLMANFGRVCELLSVNQDGRDYFGYQDMKTELPKLYANNTGNNLQYSVELIESYGHASSHGVMDRNIKLAERRQNVIASIAHKLCDEIKIEDITKEETTIIDIEEPDGVNDVNCLDAKIARCARLVVSKKLKTDATIAAEATNGGAASNGEDLTNDDSTASDEMGPNVPDFMYEIIDVTDEESEQQVIENEETPEYKYFSTLQSSDSLAYHRIVDKIRFFTPAFHSITPEGFNERLNFLHQCTRQGPTVGAVNSGENPNNTNTEKMAANLAFGRAPYCILRIGDFFNTKICIQSLSYSYETGGGVQWDLNPEGAGVQPMMCDISINFTFIGGQDIGGVVDELQNAVSENYYANSSVYNNRAKMENK